MTSTLNLRKSEALLAGVDPNDAYALADYLRTYMPQWQSRKIEDCAIYGRPLLPMVEALERVAEGREIK